MNEKENEDEQEAYHQEGVIKQGPSMADMKREIVEVTKSAQGPMPDTFTSGCIPDKKQPAQEPWTGERVKRYADLDGQLLPQGCELLAIDINAALTAERKQRDDDMFTIAEKHQKELTAERELRKLAERERDYLLGGDRLIGKLKVEIQQLRSQLATAKAEDTRLADINVVMHDTMDELVAAMKSWYRNYPNMREAIDAVLKQTGEGQMSEPKAAQEWTNIEVAQWLTKSKPELVAALAAERENVRLRADKTQALVSENVDLRNQLAAEREAHAKTAKQFVDMKAYADATDIKLSAEREKRDKVTTEFEWTQQAYKELTKQLAVLVDALLKTECHCSPPLTEKKDHICVRCAALEKVKEGK